MYSFATLLTHTVFPKRSEEELPNSQVAVQQTYPESTGVEITGKLQMYLVLEVCFSISIILVYHFHLSYSFYY